MTERTNMPELLNRFMETSNIAIKPTDTRLHRLIILRFLYSFGQVSDVDKCVAQLEEAGVDIGIFNKPTTQVLCIPTRHTSNMCPSFSYSHSLALSLSPSLAGSLFFVLPLARTLSLSLSRWLPLSLSRSLPLSPFRYFFARVCAHSLSPFLIAQHGDMYICSNMYHLASTPRNVEDVSVTAHADYTDV